MNDLKISQLMELQKDLRQAHPKWNTLCPQQGKDQLLYLVEELGEVIAIIKKKKERALMEDPAVRANLCTEFCDVLMYYTDALLCYGITAEELSDAFVKKHGYNLTRDWETQNKQLYSIKPEEKV